ncbi:hypothetical protein OSTOST_10656 [Ostertagia ostertagi]
MEELMTALCRTVTAEDWLSFGFITTTGVRMILVLEANNLEWKDFDIRSLFKRFITLLTMQSRQFLSTHAGSLLEAAAQMISTHVEG